MIVTSKDLEEFIDIRDIATEVLCDVLSKMGLEADKKCSITVPRNVVVGRIVKRVPHDSADKLSICHVDVGRETLQIVCGAKNTREGMFVAVALAGAVVKTKGSTTTIEERTLKGVRSQGMICSAEEIGLPKMGYGIMELDSSIGEMVLGKELTEYDVFRQSVLEIATTPNRGDCLCVLGIAREVASGFKRIIKQAKTIDSNTALGVGRFLQIIPSGDINYSLLYRVAEIKQDHTPLNIALTLGICGTYRDDTILNMLEYATYMTGVVLNAYAMDDKRISHNNNDARLLVKKDENGLVGMYAKTKDGEEEVFHKVSTVGVKRCINERSDYPRKFILEASFIDADTISNITYGVDDCDRDLLYRTKRGSNPNLNEGMNLLCANINKLGTKLYSGTQEITRERVDSNITITFSHIRDVIGNNIPKEEIAIILKRLGFLIRATADDDFIIVTPPEFRSDVRTCQDVSEEVLRLYDIDNLPAKESVFSVMPNSTTTLQRHRIETGIRQSALANGFVECIHYVFAHSKTLEEMGYCVMDSSKRLLNPITTTMDALRPSLLPNMIASVKRNKDYGYENLRLFEIGPVYDHGREVSIQICLLVHNKLHNEAYPHPKGVASDFFAFAQILSNVVGKFECSRDSSTREGGHSDGSQARGGVTSGSKWDPLIDPYQNARIIKNDQDIGVISKLNTRISMKYEIGDVYFAEVDMGKLTRIMMAESYAESFSKFQANKRDLTILMDRNVAFGSVRKTILGSGVPGVKNVYPLDVFTEEEDKIALTIRVIIQSQEKTLSEDEIKSCTDGILDSLHKEYGATLKM